MSLLYQQKCKGSLSSQKLTVPYCRWGSTQTRLSAASVLENNVNPYNNKTFGMARPSIFRQDSWLEERFFKLPETPCYGISNPMFSQKANKTYKAYVYLSPCYPVEQEGKKSFLSHVIFKTGGNSTIHHLPTFFFFFYKSNIFIFLC